MTRKTAGTSSHYIRSNSNIFVKILCEKMETRIKTRVDSKEARHSVDVGSFRLVEEDCSEKVLGKNVEHFNGRLSKNKQEQVDIGRYCNHQRGIRSHLSMESVVCKNAVGGNRKDSLIT